MTFPTVIEIAPQLEAVTPDTFIDRWAAVASAGKDPARHRTLAEDRNAERGSAVFGSTSDGWG
jgi:hypothetical protein